MCDLYIEEQGTVLGIKQNRLNIRSKDESVREIPIEQVDSISIMGNAQMTAACIKTCLERGIPTSYFSMAGNYYGKLQSFGRVNAKRQRLQCSLYESEFALNLAKSIVMRKIQNQKVIMRCYARSRNIDLEPYLKLIGRAREKVLNAGRFESLFWVSASG